MTTFNEIASGGGVLSGVSRLVVIDLIEESLILYLNAQSLITDLVGLRIYPIKVPQSGNYPCVVYTVSGRDSIPHHDDTGNMADVEIDFTCYATSYGSAYNIAEALRMIMDGYSLDLVKDAHSIRLEAERERFAKPQDGSDAGYYVVDQSYVILHQVTPTNL